MAGNGNGNKPWGQIKQIDADEVPPPRNAPGRWYELYQELGLRLERTGPGFALVVPFETKRDATLAQTALRKYFKQRNGEGHAELTMRGQDIFVRRGPNYAK